MNTDNKKIATILRRIADTLEIYYDNPHRIRAYRRAARTVENLDTQITDLIANGVDLSELPYIGQKLSSQIHFIHDTGKLPDFVTNARRLVKQNELYEVKGLGKKRIDILQDRFGALTKHDLAKLIHSGKIQALPGFGAKLCKQLVNSIEWPTFKKKALRYKQAELVLIYLKQKLEDLPQVKEVILAGDFRRRAEVVSEVSVLAVATNASSVISSFCNLDIFRVITTRQRNSAGAILRSGLQVNLAIVPANVLARELVRQTGSTGHVNELARSAQKLSLSLEKIQGRSEKDIYAALQLAYIEPELRENRGEIQQARKNTLPNLIVQNDIKGDLHSHTDETDGIETLENMVRAAMKLGYEYLAITDHSKRLAITNGLDEKRLLRQIKLIDQLNGRLKNFVILKSIEVDILEDGSLDLSNDVLKELDLRVCSIHSKLRLAEQQQTERILRAMDNPYFNILGHATGRLITSRPPSALNMRKIFQAAKERNCFIELNSQPSRLDINDEYCLLAKQMGVKISMSSDAHSIVELGFLKYGINQARRGWIEKDDVINTRNLDALKSLLKR